MDEARLTALFSTLGVEERKAALSSIVTALTRGLREEERQEVVKAALAGNGADARLSGMVEHWIRQCTDSGVSPLAMSREMLAALTTVYELATYSPSELRGMFADWMGEIEREIAAYVAGRGQADPEEIAGRFRLGRESVEAILEKLARERRIPAAAADRPDSP